MHTAPSFSLFLGSITSNFVICKDIKMGKIFDDRVDYAINNIWINPWSGNGEKALQLLTEAANEEDGDACFFLARCYFGPSFVNPIFGFPEDDELGYEWLNKGLEYGSPVAMFGAMRVGGFEPKNGTFVYPPFSSLREIWDKVEEMAYSGEVFCQYMIANAYYYGDCIKIFSIPDSEVSLSMVQDWMYKAIELYEKCIANGLGLGIQNLINIITSGDYGIPVNEKRASELRRIGADMKIGAFERAVGREIENENPAKAVEMYERALLHGDKYSYYYLGMMYTYNGKMGVNLPKALEYFENELKYDPESIRAKNRISEILFYGGEGVQTDYDRVFKLLSEVYNENDWGSDMLGTCYLKGLGTPVNYEKAREILSKYTADTLNAIGLGEIYCYGLGVPQDISRGMKYFDQFPNHPRVIENKRHFKKTLFGWKMI